jgi:hypothetical protein
MGRNNNNKNEVEINIQEFDMRWIGDNKILVFIGSRGRGKSVLVLDYLYYNQDIPFCACISPTDNFNLTYRPHIPSRFIFDKYTPELVKGFLKRQSEMKEKKVMALQGLGDPRYKDVDCRGILTMDDCLADNQAWRKDESIRWIFMNGRHAEITFILTMQYQIGIPPELRVNIDYVFICRESKKMEKEKLHKYYAGIFPTFEMFNQVLSECTSDMKCLIIHCLSNSDRIEDQVFWYKATIHNEPFRICYDEFWRDNNDYIKQQQSNSAVKDYDDYNKYTGTRNKVRFNVNMTNSDNPPAWAVDHGSNSNY